MAVISSKLDYTSKDLMVMLKHARGGHPQTGLDRPSAVICDWTLEIDEENITSFGNVIYGSTLVEIMEKIATRS